MKNLIRKINDTIDVNTAVTSIFILFLCGIVAVLFCLSSHALMELLNNYLGNNVTYMESFILLVLLEFFVLISHYCYNRRRKKNDKN